ncbi:uncharacterized protein J3D65DRAFT_627028 [Phyllosticta citribraziliensis]|uniref:Uncharacterized protein n=1 Tax=Phyllosticta citribraziliensis TaxID=989973 RepID=A0ABR1LLB4_9PEZI
MRRKLPWVKDREPRQQNDTSAATLPRQQRARMTPAAVNETSNNERNSRSIKNGGTTDRTPSTSPPPQPPRQPPTQEYMRDGLDADDIWVMVEDELLATSQLFTQQLHQAEYHRMKRLVRAKNESKLRNMSRSVDLGAQMSIERQKMKEGATRAENQAETLRDLDAENVEAVRNSDDSEDDATPWMFDPHLGGLMAGNPPSSSQQLAKLAGSKPKTRAAAGFRATDPKATMETTATTTTQGASIKKSTMDGLAEEIERAAASDEEADSDDLDGSSFRRGSSKSVPPPLISKRDNGDSTHGQRQISDPLQLQRKPLSKRPLFEEDESGGTGGSQNPRSTDTAARMSKLQPSSPSEQIPGASWRSRRARSVTSLWTSTEDVAAQSSTPTHNKKRREEAKGGKKSISVDEIPTFLF